MAEGSKAGSDAAGNRPHEAVPHGRVGVLLVNLGTPDGTDYWSVRRYLREFLSDRRVIEIPRFVWWPLLNLVILTTRPSRSGALYAKIWNKERNESPLRTITRAQAEKLALALGPNIRVDWAMRYGNPSIGTAIAAMKADGCDRILVAPLYPQYSAATTATANDMVFTALLKMRWQPAIRTLPPYFDDPAYIEAQASALSEGLSRLDFEPEVVIASYHGLPKAYLLKGDPYYCHCEKTTRLLRARLGWAASKFRSTYQSRFGRAEWLKPYTIQTVQELAQQGVKRIAVVMPGFSADCLETLEEIAAENAEVFHEHGGTHFSAIPCLNDGPQGMGLIEHLVRRELSGWIDG